MAFEVLITDEAFADLDTITGFLGRRASIDVARKWFSGIVGAIETLKEMPARCPRIPEAEELGVEVRLLLHGRKNRTYKVYFKIEHRTNAGGTVQVFHIRHWARQALSADELAERMDKIADERAEE